MQQTQKIPKARSIPERLVFNHGKFRLIETTPKIRLKLSKSAYWHSIGDDAYETANLGAAAAYRYAADERVEGIFRTTFQESYLPPPLSSRFPDLLDRLDPHQKEGLLWVLTRKRSYLAHAPGAGKTAQAILAACLATGEGQSVFIVPPHLTVQWEREILKFTEWLGLWPAIGRVQGSDRKARVAWNADFLIISDSMLGKPWVWERLSKMKIKLLAVDEASRFKDPFAERSLVFYGGRNGDKSYPGIYRRARHVVFLDGSPMPNRPMELWAPTYALDPEAIGCMDQNDFGYRYCGAKPNERGVWEFLYSSNEAELKEKLQARFMHVVGEEGLAHPERRRSMLFMNGDVRSLEQRTWERRHLESALGSGMGEDLSQGEMARFRRELGLRKVPWITSYVRERMAEKNESILLFVWHRDVAISLFEKITGYHVEELHATQHEHTGASLIIGGVPADYREEAFHRFQEGRVKLLIMNIAAGGRGLNLQRADRVIFGEWSWTDELNRQCEKRASRRGSEKAFVRCEYIVAPGSMDEPVLRSVFTKEKRVKRIIG